MPTILLEAMASDVAIARAEVGRGPIEVTAGWRGANAPSPGMRDIARSHG